MTTASVVLFGRSGPPQRGRRDDHVKVALAYAEAAAAAGLDDAVVVVSDAALATSLPDRSTVLLDETSTSVAGQLRSAIDWCSRRGHEALVVAVGQSPAGEDPATSADAWERAGSARSSPVAVLYDSRSRPSLVRIAAEHWPLVPLEGRLDTLWSAHPDAVGQVPEAPARARPTPVGDASTSEDRVAVESLLGRPPMGAFRVVVRDRHGGPVVIENSPLLDDGTPMPTRYWLVGRREQEAVGRLESTGGVRRAEQSVPAAEIAAAHARYAADRNAALAPGYQGPRPFGGVGGTRVGVKCLHAHLAWYLAGGSDPVGRWVVGELAGELDGVVGGVDCGTNSTRLLVAGPDGTTLERRMTITRLGEGVDRTGVLAQGAIDRTLAVLAEYREALDAHGAVAVRATATSAARDASNSAEFFAAGRAVLGAELELLSGAEEGSLSYAGATAELGMEEGPYLVVDLGGGSTELVAGARDGGAPSGISLDIGCVRITERFLTSDPPTPSELESARAFVAEALAQAAAEVPQLGVPRTMVGLAGTVSALVQAALGLDHYDREALHHRHLSRAQVDELLEGLASIPASQRHRRFGIEEARADVIVGGAVVLAGVMTAFSHDELVYSESDILDGLVADLLARAPGAARR